MNTIKVVLEEDLLLVADLEHLEREAYEHTPEDPAEFSAWDEVAAWPGVDKD